MPRPGRLYMALVHYPVYNRRGEVICAAFTNLDLHDLARVAATYGVARLFVVMPLDDQRALCESLMAHWTSGFGAGFNPDRKAAMERVVTVVTLAEATAAIEAECAGAVPRLVATAAREGDWPRVRYADLARDLHQQARPCLLLFGTASGLADEVLGLAEGVLPPIRGQNGYNHLSVRSAAAVVLDRLVGEQITGGEGSGREI